MRLFTAVVGLVRKDPVKTIASQLDRKAIARFCQERGIRKLSIFGSALRDDFEPGRSDMDGSFQATVSTAPVSP